MKKFRIKSILIFRIKQLFPLIIFLIFWELITVNSERLTFLFGSPSTVFNTFREYLINKNLIIDILITGEETILGFLLGNIIGSVIGLSLWYSKNLASTLKPYIIALGSIPIFALAPMMIIWFGTGLYAKVMMATFATIIVATVQAYEGAQNVDEEQIKLLKSFGASKFQIFKKVITPSSLVWVIASYKLNIGFALLGAFIGEFISSERGLGHLILKAGGLYDIPLVLTGILCFMFLALAINYLLSKIEKIFLPWKY